MKYKIFKIKEGKLKQWKDREINTLHRKKMIECLEPVNGEVLFDFLR
jgi:hypothetical protein